MEELIKQGKKSKFICGKREIENHILRTFYQCSGFTCKDFLVARWLYDKKDFGYEINQFRGFFVSSVVGRFDESMSESSLDQFVQIYN